MVKLFVRACPREAQNRPETECRRELCRSSALEQEDRERVSPRSVTRPGRVRRADWGDSVHRLLF